MLNYSEINSRWSTPLLVRAEAIPNCTLCASIKATQRERETVRHVLLFILVPRRSLQNYLMKTWLGMLALDVKLKSFLRALPNIAVSKDFRGSQQRGSAGGKCPPPPPSTQLKRLHQSKSQPWWLQPLTQFVSQEQSGFVTDIFWPPPLLPARHFPWLGPGLLQGLALPLLPLQLCGLQQGAQPPSSGLPASRPASGISGFHRENKKTINFDLGGSAATLAPRGAGGLCPFPLHQSPWQLRGAQAEEGDRFVTGTPIHRFRGHTDQETCLPYSGSHPSCGASQHSL